MPALPIEKIEKDGRLLALVVRNEYSSPGLSFISEESWPFQIGFHQREKGHHYKTHYHLPFDKIENFIPNKIYYNKKGKIKVNLYNENKEKISSLQLNPGDLIIFISGGHSVDVLEDSQFIEIKQGPYRGQEKDKVFLE